VRLACSTFVFDVVNNKQRTPADRMQVIRDTGFEGVEYTPLGQTAVQDAGERGALARSIVGGSGLAYASTGLFVPVPELDLALQAEHARLAAMVAPFSGQAQVDYARAAGAEVLIVHLWPGPSQVGRAATSADFERAGHALRDLLAYASPLGLPLALHNHLRNLGETEAEMDRLLAEAPGLRVCLDTGHLAAAGGDPVAAIRRWADRLEIVHLKNLDSAWQSLQADKKMIFSQLDEGCLDIGAIVDALKEAGFRGWLVVELERPAGEVPAALERERQWLRACGL
jgi:sugar phosphate isomerase/epimerase